MPHPVDKEQTGQSVVVECRLGKELQSMHALVVGASSTDIERPLPIHIKPLAPSLSPYHQ